MTRLHKLVKAFCRRPIRNCIYICLFFLIFDIFRYLVWPPVGWLRTENPDTTSFIEYRKEQWEEQQSEKAKNARAGKEMPIRQKWVSLKHISPALQKAVVVSEDDLFWEHDGFNIDMIYNAFIKNLEEGGYAAGASTITQQLAKNLWFTPNRSILRKIKEALMTRRLEWLLDKKRILELYLNVAEWGNGIYGAEAAARHYFGKSAARLSAREAAILAVMLPAPLKRSPSSPLVQRLAARLVQRMARY